jgi:isoamylase
VRRSQNGNNNAYCQDELSWFDWGLLERHADVHRFVKVFNAFRQRRDVAAFDDRLTLQELLERTPVEWHGVELGCPDFSDTSHSLAFTLKTLHGGMRLHGMVNAYWEPLRFDLPPVPVAGRSFRRCIDTALASPDDIRFWDDAPAHAEATYLVQARSVVLLALPLEPPP